MYKVTQLEDNPGFSNFAFQHFITEITVFRGFSENLSLEIRKIRIF